MSALLKKFKIIIPLSISISLPGCILRTAIEAPLCPLQILVGKPNRCFLSTRAEYQIYSAKSIIREWDKLKNTQNISALFNFVKDDSKFVFDWVPVTQRDIEIEERTSQNYISHYNSPQSYTTQEGWVNAYGGRYYKYRTDESKGPFHELLAIQLRYGRIIPEIQQTIKLKNAFDAAQNTPTNETITSFIYTTEQYNLVPPETVFEMPEVKSFFDKLSSKNQIKEETTEQHTILNQNMSSSTNQGINQSKICRPFSLDPPNQPGWTCRDKDGNYWITNESPSN